MYVVNPIDPSFPTIRYAAELGPVSDYPRPAARRDRARGQRGQLSAIAGVVLAIAAFGVGFAGGFTAASPMSTAAPEVHGPMPGEFRLGPGNLMPPGIVVPLR